jgi:hypothetical protein
VPRREVCAAVLVALLLAAGRTPAEAGPTVTAIPHQSRVRANDPLSIVPLWDTTWWITLQAQPGGAPLESLEYHAKFTDGPDHRTRTGTIALTGDDGNGLNARIDVGCPTRPDYTRPLRVRLRVRDTSGISSDWAEVDFPVHAVDSPPPLPTNPPPVTTEGQTAERVHETIGSVEIEVSNQTTIAAVREALQRKALERGGNAVVGFRLVSSTGERNTFAAEVVRYADAPALPTPTPTVVPSDRVIGEILMLHSRQ